MSGVHGWASCGRMPMGARSTPLRRPGRSPSARGGPMLLPTAGRGNWTKSAAFPALSTGQARPDSPILNGMGLDIGAIQQSLEGEGLDGWLLYDFHGSNPIASRLAGLLGGGHMTTRRWYYLIPAHGRPRGLVHAIERHNLDQLPGDKTVYAGRQQLDTGLTNLLQGVRRVAMEYSPMCAIPYLSRLD